MVVIEMEKIGDSKDMKDLLIGCIRDKAEGESKFLVWAIGPMGKIGRGG